MTRAIHLNQAPNGAWFSFYTFITQRILSVCTVLLSLQREYGILKKSRSDVSAHSSVGRATGS